MNRMITCVDHTGAEYALAAPKGATLAQAIFLSGLVEPRALCSGLGRCGQCRVRFESPAPSAVDAELAVLSQEELEAGWRLSCRHEAEPGVRVRLEQAMAAREMEILADSAPGPVALTVDLGTTTLNWEARAKGGTVARGRELNPQMGAGSEVMSRMAFAADPGNANLLRDLVTGRLKEIIEHIPGRVESLCVAGNSAMTYLLLGESLEGLSRAPYTLGYRGGSSAPLWEGGPEAYIPPLFAPFVGGDLSAGLAILCRGGAEVEYPFVLADMGTNGEFILALSETEFLAASVPLGPALEGVGLTHGSVAARGVITGFELAPDGLRLQGVENGNKARGISGTGYLSLLHILSKAGVLEQNGGFSRETGSMPLREKLLRQVVRDERSIRFLLPGGMALHAEDVEELLKVKAAFNLALARLLSEGGLSVNGLKALYLAGAMGTHVNAEDLEGLGFIPPGSAGKVRVAGNTSLAGAALLAEEPAVREWAAGAADHVRTVDLTGEADFGAVFITKMRFHYVP